LNNPPGTAAEKACHVMASVSESHYARATRDAESAAYIAESSAVDDAYTRKIVPEQVKLLEESLVNVRENTRLAPVKHMLEKILPSLTDAQKNAVSHTLTAALEARGMQGNLFDNRQDMRSSYTFRHDVIQEARRNQSAIKNAIVTQDPVLLESTCNKIAEAVYQKITEANELVPLHIPFTSEGNSSIEEEKPCVALSNSRDALYGHVSGQTAHSRVSDSVTVVSENQKKTSHKIP
jgi:hypothetical protein